MRLFTWIAFALLVGGVIFYGYAKVVLLTVLVGGGAFVLIGAYLGLRQCIRDEKNKAPDPRNPSADDFRAMKDRDKRARAQARALLDVAIVTVPATDAELRELRRLAGLQ